MPRGNRIAFPLAFLCFALASCGHAGVKAGRAPARTEPAILVSVFSDAVLLVDPATGARRTIASGLGDYQRGYASWDPKHRRIAYGDGRIVVADPVLQRVSLYANGRVVRDSRTPVGVRSDISFGDDGSAYVASPSQLSWPS